RWHELATILAACDQAVREAQTHIAIPKRFALGVREMFGLQPRLEHPRGRRALRVLQHPRFRARYDPLLLRAAFPLAPPQTAGRVPRPAGGARGGARAQGGRARGGGRARRPRGAPGGARAAAPATVQGRPLVLTARPSWCCGGPPMSE